MFLYSQRVKSGQYHSVEVQVVVERVHVMGTLVSSDVEVGEWTNLSALLLLSYQEIHALFFSPQTAEVEDSRARIMLPWSIRIVGELI